MKLFPQVERPWIYACVSNRPSDDSSGGLGNLSIVYPTQQFLPPPTQKKNRKHLGDEITKKRKLNYMYTFA